MTCKNKGCEGRTRTGLFYCYDCYSAWLLGGDDAVAARIKDMNGDKELLAELQAWRTKVQHAVVGVPEFNGQKVFRDYSDTNLFAAIYAGREVVMTADRVARSLGVDLPPKNLVARRKAVVDWLNRNGADFRDQGRVTACEIRLSSRVQELETALRFKDEEIIRMRGHVCRRQPGMPCAVAAPYGEQGTLKSIVTEAAAVRISEAARNNLHPSAKDANRANTSERLQLQRIESLAKQAATRSATPAFLCGLTLAACVVPIVMTMIWG